MSVDSIAAREALPWTGRIWTHVSVVTFEMGVLVALDLLESRVPISACPHPTEMRYFLAEVCDHPLVTVVAAISIRSVVVAGVVVLINDRLSDWVKPHARKNKPPALLRHLPARSISPPFQVLDGLCLSSVLGNAMKIILASKNLPIGFEG